jgi:F-type H+-transporting ATPase subunit delta
MRGVSRASLADARERLAALVTRTSSPESASELAGELFAVVDVLDSQPAVRRALADAASARSARTGLTQALFGSRVSADTVELVGSVASSEWSESADLADAIEQLAVEAIVADADRAGQLDDLEDDLFRFGRLVGSQAELRAALSNPFAPENAKQDLVTSLLGGKVIPQTIQLVTQAALHPRGRSLDRSLEEYARLAAEYRERLVAEVRVASELSAAQRDRLAAALAQTYGHQVHLNIVLDPGVIGGMVIRIRGEQIDGSVATRLAAIRRRLTT